jgi:IclR family pca regulon transcriptional regulator
MDRKIEKNPGQSSAQRTMTPLRNGLAVLEVLGGADDPVSIAEIAVSLNVSPATARRLVRTLADMGYIYFDGKYADLTAKCLSFAGTKQAQRTLKVTGRKALSVATVATNETMSLGILDSLETVYLVRKKAPERLSFAIDEGFRIPAHMSAMGRVLLSAESPSFLNAYFSRVPLESLTQNTITDPAQLRREIGSITSRGHAMAHGEIDESVDCLAVPVANHNGCVVASLGMPLNPERSTDPDTLEKSLKILKLTAKRITTSLSELR